MFGDYQLVTYIAPVALMLLSLSCCQSLTRSGTKAALSTVAKRFNDAWRSKQLSVTAGACIVSGGRHGRTVYYIDVTSAVAHNVAGFVAPMAIANAVVVDAVPVAMPVQA